MAKKHRRLKQESNTQSYCIEFKTTKDNVLMVTQVTIGTAWMNTTDEVRVDLADHPLYKKLQAYVLANPR